MMHIRYWASGSGSFAPHAALVEADARFEKNEVDLRASRLHSQQFLALAVFTKRLPQRFSSRSALVPRRRLELPRPCDHRHLKPARLPIPPPGHNVSQSLRLVGGRKYSDGPSLVNVSC